MHSTPGNGVANLVANAFDYKGNQVLSPLEIYFHLYIAAFLMTLTSKQTETFAYILGVLVHLMELKLARKVFVRCFHINSYTASNRYQGYMQLLYLQ